MFKKKNKGMKLSSGEMTLVVNLGLVAVNLGLTLKNEMFKNEIVKGMNQIHEVLDILDECEENEVVEEKTKEVEKEA